jgi:hypothetical protein
LFFATSMPRSVEEEQKEIHFFCLAVIVEILWSMHNTNDRQRSTYA